MDNTDMLPLDVNFSDLFPDTAKSQNERFSMPKMATEISGGWRVHMYDVGNILNNWDKPVPERKECNMSDSNKNNTTSQFTTVSDFNGMSTTILAPGATPEAVKIHVDTEERRIYIEVSDAKIPKVLSEKLDLSLAGDFEVSTRYDLDTTDFTVKDGLITITLKVSARVKTIRASK